MKIAIVFVHGMGYQNSGYSQAMQKNITRAYQLVRPGLQVADLQFKEVLWSPILKEQQRLLYQRVSHKRGLNYRLIRRFFFDYLGDAVAYQAICSAGDSQAIEVYQLIHAQIEIALAQLAEQPGLDRAQMPLVFIGHSLGTVILSHFIWDQQQLKNSALSPLETCATLAGLFTMGSPLALWSLRFKHFGTPIAFPGAGLSARLQAHARWYNFYDRNDAIATPLQPINEAYKQRVSADIAVNAGGIFSGWNPMSHMAYWRSANIAGYIAQYLLDLQQA